MKNRLATAPTIPQVLLARDREPGEEATHAWAIAEAKYVVSMIIEGGCTYNDDLDGGKAARKACERYLKRCSA